MIEQARYRRGPAAESRPLRRRRGFTLLEVLVALAILSMSYGVLMAIFGGAARNAMITTGYRQALLVGESQLALFRANQDAGTMVASGSTASGHHWQISGTPYAVDDNLPGSAVLRPQLLSVVVSWTDGSQRERSIHLNTVQIQRGRQQ